MKITRRRLLAGGAAALATSTVSLVEPAQAAIADDSYATLIDLSRCDGCQDQTMPACVKACRQGNADRFPEPAPEELRDLWPQKSHEDWSTQRQVHDRFTPYNWLFVQQVAVNGKEVFIPRRCMHCDNPPCAKLCPFGIKHKTKEGPVYIDTSLCFGGAKCRSVCPWQVPQRQSGVGIYTYWQRFMPVGGGVMFKCDLCRERLQESKSPFCMEACPKQAMKIGKRSAIMAEASQRQEKGEHLYGLEENGGTSTIYVSKISFSDIHQALRAKDRLGPGKPGLDKEENMLDTQASFAWASVLAPVAGVAGALLATAGSNREEGK